MYSSFCFNVLIINSQNSDIKPLSLILENSEYQCHIKAFACTKKPVDFFTAFDLILYLGNDFNDLDAAFLKKLKSNTPTRFIPLVYFCSQKCQANFNYLFKKGFSEILDCTMTPNEISGRIRKVISESYYLKFLNSQLEDSIKDSFESDIKNQMISDKISALEKMKSNYFQIISHELRTPLNVIFILSDILTNKSDKKNAEYCHQLKTALNQIQDLIEIGMISEQIALENDLHESKTLVNFKDLIATLSARYENEIDTNLIKFHSSCADLTFLINFEMVYKALAFTITHLYVNAPEPIEISLNAYGDDTSQTIEIINHSQGFEPDANQFLHQIIAFRTIDNKNEGLKLGIRILKSVMEYHNGKLELTDGKNNESIYKLIFYGLVLK